MKDIEMLHENGTIVYTYLNIGSIETFREYYKTYADLAIGDYENDIAMLNNAGISAAPSSGDKSAKQAAQVVVGDCTGGAVADFINYLEQR